MDHSFTTEREPETGLNPSVARPAVMALVALAVAAVILGLATAAGMAAGSAFDAWSGVDQPRAYGAGVPEALQTSRLACFLFVFQSVLVALSVAASRVLGRPDDHILSFRRPRGGGATIVASVVGLVALASLYGFAVFTLDRGAFLEDVQPFAELMRARTWWLMLLAAGIGAPIAEETLFRGFLFGILRRSALGAMGAGALTALMWAALHPNYSLQGLGAITLIGFYLAWLRERTGSLAAPIACHAAYNSLIVLTLAFAPEGVIAAG